MFKPDFADIAFSEIRKGVWKFAGRSVSGREYVYDVIDRNYVQRNQWMFVVRVPKVPKASIGVQPTVVPNRKIWGAGLDRRSLQFPRANIGRYRNRRYAKFAISDIHGKKTRIILNEDVKALPMWLRMFKPIPKRKVARSKANDGGDFTAVFEPTDHSAMIRLFLALKPWVLDDGYTPAESRRAAKARHEWRKTIRKRRSLKDLNVVVTGILSQGTRLEVLDWLKSLGARPQHRINGKTNLVILGPHYLGDDRKKIKVAKKMNISMMTEASFYQRYLR
jgi:hypothetical protein